MTDLSREELVGLAKVLKRNSDKYGTISCLFSELRPIFSMALRTSEAETALAERDARIVELEKKQRTNVDAISDLEDSEAALQKRNAELERLTTPREITDAQRDGEHILAWGSRVDGWQRVFWRDGSKTWETEDGFVYPENYFTHYLPLPSDPVGDEK